MLLWLRYKTESMDDLLPFTVTKLHTSFLFLSVIAQK